MTGATELTETGQPGPPGIVLSTDVLGVWQPIATAPRDGSNLLLRFGLDGVSQGKFVPGLPHPWKFIDTNDGITWLVNHAIDGPGGPSHWMPMPR